MGEDPAEKREVQSRSGLFHLNKLGRLPGAVHLLPLVEHHITAYCQALRTFEKSGAGLSENQSLSSSSTGRSVASSTEDSLSSIVDPALASLGILHHLVFYSLDTVSVLLQSATSAGPPAAPTSEAGQESRTLRPPETVVEEPSPHSLFKKLVQPLCSLSVTCHRDVVRNETLRVLVKLAENSPYELLTRSVTGVCVCLPLDHYTFSELVHQAGAVAMFVTRVSPVSGPHDRPAAGRSD
ncbi:hypothetical protein FKM82_004630 [Ascaphus truei]